MNRQRSACRSLQMSPPVDAGIAPNDVASALQSGTSNRPLLTTRKLSVAHSSVSRPSTRKRSPSSEIHMTVPRSLSGHSTKSPGASLGIDQVIHPTCLEMRTDNPLRPLALESLAIRRICGRRRGLRARALSLRTTRPLLAAHGFLPKARKEILQETSRS